MIDAELIDKMGTDLTVVNAARVSFGAISEKFSDRDHALIKFLAKHNHVTPFRHPTVSIRCKAPIFLARQLGKHQVGFSWNEISRRYKDGEAIEFDFYVPNIVFGRPEKLMTQVAQPLLSSESQYIRSTICQAYDMALKSYEAILAAGGTPEQARMVLPQGMMTEWVWTGSLYGFYSLWLQRSDSHAQHEAQVFAERINKIMMEHFPICWSALTNKD